MEVPFQAPALPAVRKPRVWTPFVALLTAFVGAQILGIIVYIALVFGVGFVHGMNGTEPADLQAEVIAMVDGTFLGALLALLPFQGALLIVTLLAARLSPVSLKRRLGFVRPAMPAHGWLATALAPLATVAIAMVIATVMSLLTPYDPNSSALNVDQPTLLVTLAITALTSLIPAFVEEMLFRGYLQRRLLERWSPIVAVAISSILFALMHMDSIHHIIAVLPLGILLGVLAYRTKSIVPGVLFHGLHNLYCGGFGLLGELVTNNLSDTGAGVALLATLGACGLVGLPATVYLMFRRIQPVAVLDDIVLADEILEPADDTLVQPLVPAAAMHQYVDDPLTTLSA
jgi:membrane protease YdiL (CAAX protease family)